MQRSFSLVTVLLLMFPTSLWAQEPSGETEVAVEATVADDISAIILRVDTAENPRVQTKIAVPDAMNLGSSDPQGVGDTISETLRRCLTLAGHFDVLGPETYFFDQHSDGMTESTINFANWFNIDAQGLIKTAFRMDDGQVRLDFRFYNVATGEQVNLGWEPVTVSTSRVQREVFSFVNELVQHYTGYEGPFGSGVAFVGRGQDNSREIHTMVVGGGGAHQVTDNRNTNILPRWRQGRLFFTSYISGTASLYTIDEEENLIPISERPGLNTGAILSPDGDVIAMTLSMDGQTEIYLINAEDGSIVQRLTDNLYEDVSASWSPSGSQIAFVSDRSGDPHVYIMNRDGSNQRRVTFAGTYNTTPEWSPDGTLIAFSGRDSRARFDVFTVDIATSHIERLTQDQGNNEEPTWSSNGQYLIFTSTRSGGEPRLFMMTADGNYQALLTDFGTGFYSASWHR